MSTSKDDNSEDGGSSSSGMSFALVVLEDAQFAKSDETSYEENIKKI